MGIDYGMRRVGFAVTDPLKLIATPLKTLEVHVALSFLHSYTTRESVDTIVVGWPRHLSGRICNMTLRVRQFVRLLRRHFPTLTIATHDERFTSTIAQRSLLEAGFKKKKRTDKGLLDQISATLILRSFLDTQKFHKAQPPSSPTAPQSDKNAPL